MLVGRNKEISILNDTLNSEKSELIAVYGRRRVGKTFLIREVFKKHILFEFTGIYKGTMKVQLKNFMTQINGFFDNNNNKFAPKDWLDAFEILKSKLETKRGTKKKVIFIDEFPWMASPKSGFLSAFENFWNTYCTKREDLIIVICGSAASYMINKIIKNKGGLHGRLTNRIRLMPFNLNETEQFLTSKGIQLKRYDILQLYMTFGGIPHYLEKCKKGESVTQNIDRLCFEENGILADEFNEIFSSLFSNSERHELIIKALSASVRGISRELIIEKTGIPKGGGISKAINELIESGFVTKYKAFKKKERMSLYRLSDEYSNFYLKYVKPNIGQGKGTWMLLSQKQSYKSWSGFAFESLCLKHINHIKKALGVLNVYSVNSSWFNKKAQIDLIIDREDRIINLCEMKFYNKEYIVSNIDYNNIKNKILEFESETQTRKNINLTMITTYGVKQNDNSLSIVSNEIKMDDLFGQD